MRCTECSGKSTSKRSVFFLLLYRLFSFKKHEKVFCAHCKGSGIEPFDKIIADSLKHWFRMRRWVKRLSYSVQQRPFISFRSARSVMKSVIEETFTVDYCSLCNLFYSVDCASCYITKSGGIPCNSTASVWMRCSVATTWQQWYTASATMIQLLWSLRYFGKRGQK